MDCLADIVIHVVRDNVDVKAFKSLFDCSIAVTVVNADVFHYFTLSARQAVSTAHIGVVLCLCFILITLYQYISTMSIWNVQQS